jgi:hypothetical protein
MFQPDSPQEIVDAVIADLKRRGMSLEIEGESINVSAQDSSCGGAGHLEGYGLARGAENVSQNIKAAHVGYGPSCARGVRTIWRPRAWLACCARVSRNGLPRTQQLRVPTTIPIFRITLCVPCR